MKKKKMGLVIEGGGMRGAHSCGVLMAMIQKGLTDFDVVAATSAGACTAAFLVSRQFDLFPLIWTKYLHDGRFINLKNLGRRGRSVMDLDFLIHEVFKNLEPLDIEAIRQSPTRFYIPATDCETGEAVYFNNHEDSILNALKASAALPVAYRTPVVIKGHRFVDGGISDPIPVQKVVDEGCDEVYVILTRLEGYRKKPPLINLLPRIYQKKYPALAESLARRYLRYNEALEKIEKGDFPARLIVIRPTEKPPVGRLTRNQDKIVAALEQGYREAMHLLSQDLSYEEVRIPVGY